MWSRSSGRSTSCSERWTGEDGRPGDRREAEQARSRAAQGPAARSDRGARRDVSRAGAQEHLHGAVSGGAPESLRTFPGAPRLNINPTNGVTLCISCDLCAIACPEKLIKVISVRNPETRRKDLVGFTY